MDAAAIAGLVTASTGLLAAAVAAGKAWGDRRTSERMVGADEVRAAIEALSSTIERLEAENNRLHTENGRLQVQIDALRAEVDKLRALVDGSAR